MLSIFEDCRELGLKFGYKNEQRHCQDPGLTPTLLLTWARAWAGYVRLNNA